MRLSSRFPRRHLQKRAFSFIIQTGRPALRKEFADMPLPVLEAMRQKAGITESRLAELQKQANQP